MSESIFDTLKNYYVFKYVYDVVNEKYTALEGEIKAFVKATDCWDAIEKSGLTDTDAYGANLIENLSDFEKAISTERKHLTKISKQLKEMTDERDAEIAKFTEERPCPNGCGKLDEHYRCPICGFGHETDVMIEDIDKLIAEEKKKGNDTSELEAIRNTIAQTIPDNEDS